LRPSTFWHPPGHITKNIRQDSLDEPAVAMCFDIKHTVSQIARPLLQRVHVPGIDLNTADVFFEDSWMKKGHGADFFVFSGIFYARKQTSLIMWRLLKGRPE